MAKKMVIKSEPPHLANFTTTTPVKVNKSNIISSVPVRNETVEQKMVQIPMPDYLELVKQISQLKEERKELRERVSRLEEHCEKTGGFIRNRTATQH